MSIHTTDCTSCSEIQNAIRKQIIALSNTVSSQSQLGTNHMSNPAPVSNSVPVSNSTHVSNSVPACPPLPYYKNNNYDKNYDKNNSNKEDDDDNWRKPRRK